MWVEKGVGCPDPGFCSKLPALSSSYSCRLSQSTENLFRNHIFYPPASGERYGGIYSPLFFFSSESELQTASFLTEVSVTYLYSQLTPVCQASVALLRGTSRGWGEIYSKGTIFFINISQPLNTTPHCVTLQISYRTCTHNALLCQTFQSLF